MRVTKAPYHRRSERARGRGNESPDTRKLDAGVRLSLGKQLRTRYDETLREAVPERLAERLTQLDERRDT